MSAGTGAGAAEEVLGAGQQVGFADGRLGRPVAIDAAAALAWRQGWLSFYRRPLAEVLDELARYYPDAFSCSTTRSAASRSAAASAATIPKPR